MMQRKGHAMKQAAATKHEPVHQRFFYRWETWPHGQSVQPGDDPPVLRSVDALDPPGRLASQDDSIVVQPVYTYEVHAT
jgi:hypothetical protein